MEDYGITSLVYDEWGKTRWAYLADERWPEDWNAAYKQARAEEIAGFDAYGYFADDYAEYEMSAANFVEMYDLTEEMFQNWMLDGASRGSSPTQNRTALMCPCASLPRPLAMMSSETARSRP